VADTGLLVWVPLHPYCGGAITRFAAGGVHRLGQGAGRGSVPDAYAACGSGSCGNNTNLTMRIIEQYFGREGWGNNTYQREIWSTLFSRPQEIVTAVFKGGPLYVLYLAAIAAGKSSALPGIVAEKYPCFSARILLQVMFVYAAPFLFYFAAKKSGWFGYCSEEAGA
jgi:hypothetical protein